MWLQFSLACAIALIVIFPLGILVTSSLRLTPIGKLATAPMVSVFLLSVSSMSLNFVGIPANPITIGTASILFACIAKITAHFISKKTTCKVQTNLRFENIRHGKLIICSSFIAAAFVTIFVFVESIDNPASLFQSSDAVFHLAKVETFINSSSFSFSHDPYYATQQEATYQLSSSFYPSAWHVICALIAQCSGMNVPIAANAENIIIASVLFPLSSAYLTSEVCNGDPRITGLATIASTAFVNFPWGMIIWGPLFPNALSFSMLPALLSLFVSSVNNRGNALFLIQRMPIVIIGTFSLLFAQPNVIFSAILLLLPFCIASTWRYADQRFGRNGSIIFSALVITTFITVWEWCFHSPLFSGVVSFEWPPTHSVKRALFDAVTYGMNGIPSEPILTVLICFGIYGILKSKRNVWLIASWILAIIQYVICVSQDSILQHQFCGFWYSDAHRIAANVVVISVPIIAIGTYKFLRVILFNINQKDVNLRIVNQSKNAISFLFLLIIGIVIYWPSPLPESFPLKTDAYGYLHNMIKLESSDDQFQVLTNEELLFSQKALSLVPKGSLIINSPNDGSCFLYSTDNANVLYRAISLPNNPASETKPGREIRRNLAQISTDANLREDINELNAHYVLLLDHGERKDEHRLYFWSYYPDQWEGIESINDSTPGFTVILAEKDMRLYKIDE